MKLRRFAISLLDAFITQAAQHRRRIVFPEGPDERIIHAAAKSAHLGTADPVLMVKNHDISHLTRKFGLDCDVISLGEPKSANKLEEYAQVYANKRNMPKNIARRIVQKPMTYGAMMVASGDADGMVAGVSSPTSLVLQAATLAIGLKEGISAASSFFIMDLEGAAGRGSPLIFADCAVAIQPSPAELADIAVSTARNAARLMEIEPRVAFLSFSTKGSANHEQIDWVVEALEIARTKAPDIPFDGELQADAALVESIARKKAPHSKVAGHANVLIFPNLASGNIGYKLVQHLAGARAIGPILQGFGRPVNDMSRGATVEDIVAVTAITALQVE
ncbi:MAG: phosphate acetyltransferase [Chitinivibrionales bacterium]|nr:phosphate acetyltransferase [Chitinivibrionales bacterium]